LRCGHPSTRIKPPKMSKTPFCPETGTCAPNHAPEGNVSWGSRSTSGFFHRCLGNWEEHWSESEINSRLEAMMVHSYREVHEKAIRASGHFLSEASSVLCSPMWLRLLNEREIIPHTKRVTRSRPFHTAMPCGRVCFSLMCALFTLCVPAAQRELCV
jgi:hypothetical protein